MGRLLIVQRRAALLKHFGMANAAIAADTLVVLFVIERDVAVGGFEQDRVGRGECSSGWRFGRGRRGCRSGIRPDLRSAEKTDRSGDKQYGCCNQKNGTHFSFSLISAASRLSQ